MLFRSKKLRPELTVNTLLSDVRTTYRQDIARLQLAEEKRVRWPSSVVELRNLFLGLAKTDSVNVLRVDMEPVRGICNAGSLSPVRRGVVSILRSGMFVAREVVEEGVPLTNIASLGLRLNRKPSSVIEVPTKTSESSEWVNEFSKECSPNPISHRETFKKDSFYEFP